MSDLKLLYVEDDAVVRENFKEILEHYFAQVITGKDGLEAYALYKEHHPDVLILDISLPHKSGLDVASQIREYDNTTEIIMLTAYSDETKLLRAANLQINAYLVKPVDAGQLDDTINKLISKKATKAFLNLYSNFTWNLEDQELYYKKEEVPLSKNERTVMRFLSENKKQFFSACEISNEVFDALDSSDSHCNSMVQIISRFKSKISKNYPKEEFFILNTYAVGYKLLIKES